MTKKHLLLLSLLLACTNAKAQNEVNATGGADWKPVKDAVATGTTDSANATVLRVITKWTMPGGSDSVTVNVSFGTQAPQIKQYPPTRTTDTSSFNLIAGETSTGGSIITAIKVGKIPTPVSVNFGPFSGTPLPPPTPWPGVTGATAVGDTL